MTSKILTHIKLGSLTLSLLFASVGVSGVHAQSIVYQSTNTGSLNSVTAPIPKPYHFTGAVLLMNQIIDCQNQGVFADANGDQINRYGGEWNNDNGDQSFIQWAEPNLLPMNYTECAPLVTRIFQAYYNWEWDDYTFNDTIEGNPNKKTASPQPYQIIAMIKKGGILTKIDTLNAARAGDILNWWNVGTTANDHTMIISSVNWASAKTYPGGLANSNANLVGLTYYEVRVIDSSSSTHTADTRMVNGQHIPGIGSGIIGLLVDGNSQIKGFTWSLPSSNYVTQKNSWVGDLNGKLKLTPAWEAIIGRKP